MTKQITFEEVMLKVNGDEPLTVEEVEIYYKNYKPVEHVYGKYGNLAKEYIKDNLPKLWDLGADLPKYLHGIDKRAENMYETMYESLSKQEEFKRTGDYITDVRRMNQIKAIIEETILKEIVYVD